MDDFEARIAAAERRAKLALDAHAAVNVKLGALEAIVVQLARDADLGVRNTDRLMDRLGSQYSPDLLPHLRKELLRLLHRGG